jgi:hypothetical protein
MNSFVNGSGYAYVISTAFLVQNAVTTTDHTVSYDGDLYPRTGTHSTCDTNGSSGIGAGINLMDVKFCIP